MSPPTIPPPTPRRKLLPPLPDKGEDGEKDLPPEGGGGGRDGLEGLPKDLDGLLPNPPLLELPLEPPKDLPPLLDRASARSEKPRTTSSAKSNPRSDVCLRNEE
jgi:hypothetical protein